MRIGGRTIVVMRVLASLLGGCTCDECEPHDTGGDQGCEPSGATSGSATDGGAEVGGNFLGGDPFGPSEPGDAAPYGETGGGPDASGITEPEPPSVPDAVALALTTTPSDAQACASCIATPSSFSDAGADVDCAALVDECAQAGGCTTAIECVLGSQRASALPASCALGVCGGHDGSGLADQLFACVELSCAKVCGGLTGALSGDPPLACDGPADGAFVVRAMNDVFVGDTGWDGTVSPNGDDWQAFARNVDGMSFTDPLQLGAHCLLRPGGDVADEVLDGPNGVDDSFGRNVLPIWESLVSTPSDVETKWVQGGGYSLVLRLAGADVDGGTSDAVGELFETRGSDVFGLANGEPVPPTDAQLADGTYLWHPATSALVDPSLLDPGGYRAATQFPMSHVANGVWTSASPSDVPLAIVLTVSPLPLVVHRAVVTITLGPGDATVTGDTLTGVLATDELLAVLHSSLAQTSTSFCGGGAADSILAEIAATSDMGADGTQDPTKLCDGISFALGFRTKAALLGTPAPVGTTTDPCAHPFGGDAVSF